MPDNIPESPQTDRIPPTKIDGLDAMIDTVSKTKKDGYKGDTLYSVWRVNPVDLEVPDYFDDRSQTGYFDRNSTYVLLHSENDSRRLSELDQQLHSESPLGLSEQATILGEVGRLAGIDASGKKFEAIYKDGSWTDSFGYELDERQQVEDDDWFEAQREGFRRMEEGEPQEPRDEPWRAELQAKAIEVARGDGRGHPEEADFNTAMILLGDKVPKQERERFNRDLQAIEEGRSSGNH